MPRARSPADALLESAQRVLDLSLTVHVREPLTGAGLSARYTRHMTPACLAMKRREYGRCMAFDGRSVHEALRREPRGRLHVCPFGMTELAVPLQWRGRQCGVLFAGQRWQGPGAPPHPGLRAAPDPAWLQDRLVLLRGVARELSQLLRPRQEALPERRQIVLRFLSRRLAEPVGIAELASALALSPSRARHLVTELFGQSFTHLQQEARLLEAGRLLVVTDQTIGEIATAVGFPDPNYFSRLFKRAHGLSPRAYRRKMDRIEG